MASEVGYPRSHNSRSFKAGNSAPDPKTLHLLHRQEHYYIAAAGKEQLPDAIAPIWRSLLEELGTFPPIYIFLIPAARPDCPP